MFDKFLGKNTLFKFGHILRTKSRGKEDIATETVNSKSLNEK